MRLYYIRHGLTDWNSAGRLQGHRDVPINPEGRAQAACSAAILCSLLARDGRAAVDLDYVSSPLVRARETMEIIRTKLDLPRSGYTIEPRLIEIGFGEWEGLTYAEVQQRDPDIVARREADKWQFQPPGGENYQQVAARVGTWHATLTRDTVVCAHGGTGRALVAVLGAAPPDQAVHREIDQGVVYIFEQNILTRCQ
jgi:broad specificity phosphatase PhoE